jgi:hypothetical protein
MRMYRPLISTPTKRCWNSTQNTLSEIDDRFCAVSFEAVPPLPHTSHVRLWHLADMDSAT